VLVPLFVVFHPTQAAQITAVYAVFLLWVAYFGFAASQFSTGNRALAAIKGAVAAVVAQGAITAVASAITVLWER